MLQNDILERSPTLIEDCVKTSDVGRGDWCLFFSGVIVAISACDVHSIYYTKSTGWRLPPMQGFHDWPIVLRPKFPRLADSREQERTSVGQETRRPRCYLKIAISHSSSC